MGGSQPDGLAVIAVIIAGYAAFVSTCVLVWNIISARRKRAEVRIIGRVIRIDSGDGKVNYVIDIAMANIGRRATTIVSWEIKYGDQRRFQASLERFETLEPGGQPATLIGPGEQTKERLLIQVYDVVSICVRDSSGKDWEMWDGDFQNFKTDAIRYLKE